MHARINTQYIVTAIPGIHKHVYLMYNQRDNAISCALCSYRNVSRVRVGFSSPAVVIGSLRSETPTEVYSLTR
jgi:hypothetical protein